MAGSRKTVKEREGENVGQVNKLRQQKIAIWRGEKV